MVTTPNKISQFWQELKRRKVSRVITVYAAAAFVVLELGSIISEPLKFPEWFMPMVIVLLCIGFIIAVILSWIYDIHPEGGIVKTEPATKVSEEERPSSNGWKIASYISFVIIIGLIILNIFPRSEKIEILDKSIAVLPFKNFSTEPDQDAVCHGLTDEIINHLFKIESFDKVASLSSVLTYRDSEKLIPIIAEELDVNYILEGTYRKFGDRVRVTAQLIEAAKDKHLWQKEYDRPYQYEELIAIQSEIALQIADHLKAFLSSSVEEKIKKVPNTNQEAFELMQLAGYLSYANNSFAPDSQSLGLALKAVELAPGYAEAYASAGAIIITMANYGGGLEMRTAGWEGLRYLEKALDLDPENALSHIGLAMFNDWFKWDYVEAEQEFLKFGELTPGNYMWRSQYGELLIKLNRLEDAKAYFHISEPFFYDAYREYRRLIYSGQIREARHALDQFKQTYTEAVFYKWFGEAYLWLVEYDSARYYLESAVEEHDLEMMNVPRHQANLALTYYHQKDSTGAQAIIQKLKSMSKESSAMSPDFFTGWYYSAIGEVDSAFYWLEKAYENRSPEIPWLKVDPAFSSLKEDPRYWDLYERTGHKAYDEYMASRNK